MVEFLKTKFGEKRNPACVVKEISESRQDVDRAKKHLQKFATIEGPSTFQAMCFKPNAISSKASPFICICKSCEDDYGSCVQFTLYSLQVQMLNEISLRSTENLHVDTDAPTS